MTKLSGDSDKPLTTLSGDWQDVPSKPLVDALLRERGRQYGDAWELSGEVMATLAKRWPDKFATVFSTRYGYAFTVIVGKIVRALHNPFKRDNWADIEGFAHLVVADIDANDDDGPDPQTYILCKSASTKKVGDLMLMGIPQALFDDLPIGVPITAQDYNKVDWVLFRVK